MFQPGFKMHFKFVKSSTEDSVLKLEFVGGYTKRYFLENTPFSMILREIRVLNEQIELHRSFNGIDDVPDDEH